MKVREIMTTDVSAATSNTSINQVARTMKELNIGVVPVCDENDRPIGIVTDRDIVVRGVVSDIGGHETVDKIMSTHVVFASPEMHVHEVVRIMGENQIRRLPVVENGRIIGMVAIGDLAVHNIYENEAGHALSEISTPSRPMM